LVENGADQMLAENCASLKPLPDVGLMLQHVKERFYAADE
jgi:hypothetical protein